MTTEEIIDALRELKYAVEPVVADDDGLVEGSSNTVTGDELARLQEAWARAVGVIGRIEHPAQYRPI